MAERERSLAGVPAQGVFAARTQVMTADDVDRAVRRMAHEILERNHGAGDLLVVGMQTGGVALSSRIAAAINDIEGSAVPTGTLDATMHRDDFGLRPVMPEAATDMPVDPSQRTVVLVDDVLFTGRTVRAAMDAIHAYGRPRSIQLAVMVDRGHRELPIRPDYVGKNLPTRRDEVVDVNHDGVQLGEMVEEAS